MNDNTEKLIYYKKILIFGIEGSGKTSLSKRLKTDNFSFEKHTDGRKI
jgi:GTPase SAR1 family protein